MADGTTISVTTSNEIYVSPIYKGVSPAEKEFILKKQKAAENFYQAFISGDSESITQYKAEFIQIVNPDSVSTITIDSVNSDKYTPPNEYRVENLYQNPQEKYYYCGPAAAQSVLENLGVTRTQSQLASTAYLQTEKFGNTPWYLSDSSDYTQYPMLMTLRNCVSESGGRNVGYIPSPMAPAGSSPLTLEQCKGYVVSTTGVAHAGVVACGTSKATNGYHLPNYPNSNIGHWLVSDGYTLQGDQIWIIDPAADSPALSWSGSIDPYYQISAQLFRNFVSTHGIIW